MGSHIISQVSYDDFSIHSHGISMGPPVSMDLRGQVITITRHELSTLPESILLCLFPHGFGLETEFLLDAGLGTKRQDTSGGEPSTPTPINIDFDPACLQYILQKFREHSPQTKSDHESTENSSAKAIAASSLVYPSLSQRVALIVLREDLDFFPIPDPWVEKSGVSSLKRLVANMIENRRSVFEGLKRHKPPQTRTNSSSSSVYVDSLQEHKVSAEQLLIEMLCSSGFNIDDDWGYRATEPSKTAIGSIKIVQLKGDQEGNKNEHELGTAQKLMLFWRKPARKCWWDHVLLENLKITNSDNNSSCQCNVKVWIRRVWTLELTVLD